MSEFLTANPSYTGTVPDSSLGSYWPTGYEGYPGAGGWTRTSTWSNVVETGGVLYVYSVGGAGANELTLDGLHKKLGETTMFGHKDATTGHLITVSGTPSNIVLPAAIGDDEIVIMGR